MERRRESTATAEEQDPNSATAFLLFVEMEKLLDKLKVLNYDKEFVQDLKMKPINRHYFALPTNTGEQFYAFTSICAWLIRKTGKRFEQPQEFDDPNATISKILDSLRSTGVAIDFPPSKLKQGVGEHAIFVLDHLVEQALKVAHFTWKKPIAPEEQEVQEEVAEDESELLLERVEEEMQALSDDEADDALLRVDDLQGPSKFDIESQQPEHILESNTDIESWKLELERVLPQLKVTVKSGKVYHRGMGKYVKNLIERNQMRVGARQQRQLKISNGDNMRDWRAHLEQMQTHRQSISSALDGTKSQLESLHLDIAHSMEKIGAREKFLNNQMEPLLAEYRKLQTEVTRMKEQYAEVSGGVQERTRTLILISDELDAVKQEMEERGASMTDGTPLVKLKKTVTRIQAEITAMDVRLGVLDHSLMRARLRDKALLQQEIGSEVV